MILVLVGDLGWRVGRCCISEVLGSGEEGWSGGDGWSWCVGDGCGGCVDVLRRRE